MGGEGEEGRGEDEGGNERWLLLVGLPCCGFCAILFFDVLLLMKGEDGVRGGVGAGALGLRGGSHCLGSDTTLSA